MKVLTIRPSGHSYSYSIIANIEHIKTNEVKKRLMKEILQTKTQDDGDNNLDELEVNLAGISNQYLYIYAYSNGYEPTRTMHVLDKHKIKYELHRGEGSSEVLWNVAVIHIKLPNNIPLVDYIGEQLLISDGQMKEFWIAFNVLRKNSKVLYGLDGYYTLEYVGPDYIKVNDEYYLIHSHWQSKLFLDMQITELENQGIDIKLNVPR
jgi:hypothetical protein